jgi:hypothetical protein
MPIRDNEPVKKLSNLKCHSPSTGTSTKARDDTNTALLSQYWSVLVDSKVESIIEAQLPHTGQQTLPPPPPPPLKASSNNTDGLCGTVLSSSTYRY